MRTKSLSALFAIPFLAQSASAQEKSLSQRLLEEIDAHLTEQEQPRDYSVRLSNEEEQAKKKKAQVQADQKELKKAEQAFRGCHPDVANAYIGKPAEKTQETLEYLALSTSAPEALTACAPELEAYGKARLSFYISDIEHTQASRAYTELVLQERLRNLRGLVQNNRSFVDTMREDGPTREDPRLQEISQEREKVALLLSFIKTDDQLLQISCSNVYILSTYRQGRDMLKGVRENVCSPLFSKGKEKQEQ